MTGSGKASPRSLNKSLSLLVRVVEGGPFSSLSALAAACDLPVSTVHRLLAGLEQAGFIAKLGRAQYVGGPTLRRLARAQGEANMLLAQIGEPILAGLSRRARRVVHLGVLEDNMMTYLVKVGDSRNSVASRLGMQLEAYCSGLGKALLAHLPDVEREAYLATGPFVRLTSNTITLTDALRSEFARIRECGYAIDDGEMFPGLVCIAVPIRCRGRVVAAISLIVTQNAEPCRPVAYLGRLRAAARRIEDLLVSFDDVLVGQG